MIAALLDHVWQSTLFALACALLTLMLRNNRAAVRYGIWLAASAKFLMPFSLLTAAGGFLFRPVVAPVSAPIFQTMQPAVQPFSAAVPALAASGAAGIDWSVVLLALWAAGFAAVMVVTAMRWVRLRDQLRDAADLPSPFPVPVKLSSTSLEPGLIGIRRPVLVLPEGFDTRLSGAEVQAVLAHELCHLKRRDNLTIAVHMLVEALFWFHPLVWWIGARLIEERENACDEAVLQSGNDPQVYAESILKVCKHYLHSPLPSASSVSGADLKMRIESIFQNRSAAHLGPVQKGLLATGATASVILPLALGLVAAPPFLVSSIPDNFVRRFVSQVMPHKQVAIDPALYAKYAGTYLLDPQTVITVRWVGGHFLSHETNQPDVEFYPESRTEFFAKSVRAEISFVTGAHGPAKAMVVHQGGSDIRAGRIDAATAKAVERASVAHFRSQKQEPGTEAALRTYIASLEAGRPDYQDMTAGLAATTRLQMPGIKGFVRHWGAVKAIAFAGVSPQSGDMYVVDFEHGRALFAVAPLLPDGRMHGLYMRPLR